MKYEEAIRLADKFAARADDPRKALHVARVRGNRVYATDGYVMARIDIEPETIDQADADLRRCDEFPFGVCDDYFDGDEAAWEPWNVSEAQLQEAGMEYRAALKKWRNEQWGEYLKNKAIKCPHCGWIYRIDEDGDEVEEPDDWYYMHPSVFDGARVDIMYIALIQGAAMGGTWRLKRNKRGVGTTVRCDAPGITAILVCMEDD